MSNIYSAVPSKTRCKNCSSFSGLIIMQDLIVIFMFSEMWRKKNWDANKNRGFYKYFVICANIYWTLTFIIIISISVIKSSNCNQKSQPEGVVILVKISYNNNRIFPVSNFVNRFLVAWMCWISLFLIRVIVRVIIYNFLQKIIIK